MPSSVSHALAAVAIGAPLAPPRTTPRYWVVGILCSVTLDLDAVGRVFGGGDLAVVGGHRALTHSLLFAVVVGMLATWTAFRDAHWDGARLRIAAYLILATASHGILDAFTSYGSGVAFLFPLTPVRYSSPWRPLNGLNEALYIWTPAILLIAVAWRVNARRRRPDPTSHGAPNTRTRGNRSRSSTAISESRAATIRGSARSA